MEKQFNRGSEWRKWDLHVHSPKSHGYTGKWEQFKTQLQNANCEVIGINDYFTVAGYKKLTEEISEGKFDIGGKTILPIVEMRMKDMLQRKNTKTNSATHFNFHIIFSDEIKITEIENFIKSLDFDGTTIGDSYDDKEKLKDVKVSFDQTLEKLKRDSKFKDKFLIWLPYNEYGGIEKIDPNADKWIKGGFIKQSDIIGSSNQKQIDFFLWNSKKEDGSLKYSQAEFKEWFEYKKPCIKGSDSHSHTETIGKLKDENSEQIDKFCWIKADPTFEGLKQIVYEPEERVKIQKENPSFSFNKPFFSNISIKEQIEIFDTDRDTDKVRFKKNQEIPLNKNLVTFIGGRGTGKSLFLKYLGSTFGELTDNQLTKDKNFIVDYQKENIVEGEIQEFNQEEKNRLDFVFIEQGEIKNIIKGDGLKSQIKKLLGLENLKFNDALHDEISTILKDIENTLDWFNNTDEEGYPVNQEEYNEGIKKDNEKLINTITTKGNKQKLENYTKNIKEIEKLKDNIILIDNFENKLKETKESFNIDIAKINELFNKEDDLLSPFDFSQALEKLEKLKTRLNKQREEIDEQLRIVKGQFESEGYKGDLTNLLNSVEKYRNKITEADKKLEEIKSKKDTLNALRAKRKALGGKIKQEYERQKQILEDKWNNLSQNGTAEQKEIIKELITNDIGFKVSIDFNEREFYNLILRELDGRSFRDYDSIKRLGVEIANFDDWVNFFKKDEFDEVIENQYLQVIRKALFDLETRHQYLRVIPEITYKDKTIDKLSAGQKGTLYLRLQLSTKTFSAPIVFDQPEDDLDNQFIINELVPLIKKLKEYRQIIIATHNANLVINADAEQIIVASNNDEILSYKSGSIENTEIKNNICKILEGGEEAFENRRKKYSIRTKSS